MLGAILGDIMGSVYEFNQHGVADTCHTFPVGAHYTDDTVCTIACADWLMRRADAATTLKEWVQKYRLLNYGQMFRRWAFSAQPPEPYGSFGNGAAMRISPVGWYAVSLNQALNLCDEFTKITHNHPEGMRGARAVVEAVWLARQGASPAVIRQQIQQHTGYDLEKSVKESIYQTRCGTCQNTVPQALICALSANSFSHALELALSLGGGDIDTLAAITGSVAEARFSLPDALVHQALALLSTDMRKIVKAFSKKVATRITIPAVQSPHDWLARFLMAAAERDTEYCYKLGCTTCGAMKFRKEFFRALYHSVGQAAPSEIRGISIGLDLLISYQQALDYLGQEVGEIIEHSALHEMLSLIDYDMHNCGAHRIERFTEVMGPRASYKPTSPRKPIPPVDPTIREEQKRVRQKLHQARTERNAERTRQWRGEKPTTLSRHSAHSRSPSNQLVQAYRNTQYVIFNGSQRVCEIKVGQVCAQLVSLLAKENVSSAAILTAYNPFSISLSAGENSKRQSFLRDDLRQPHPYKVLRAKGYDPLGHWKAEPSFCVLGIRKSEAEKLAYQYEQYAFVFCDASGIPELVVLDIPPLEERDST